MFATHQWVNTETLSFPKHFILNTMLHGFLFPAKDRLSPIHLRLHVQVLQYLRRTSDAYTYQTPSVGTRTLCQSLATISLAVDGAVTYVHHGVKLL